MDYLESTENYMNPDQFQIVLKAIPNLKNLKEEKNNLVVILIHLYH